MYKALKCNDIGRQNTVQHSSVAKAMLNTMSSQLVHEHVQGQQPDLALKSKDAAPREGSRMHPPTPQKRLKQ